MAVGLTVPERALVVWMQAAGYWGLGKARWQLWREPDLSMVRADIGLRFGPGECQLADIYYPADEPRGTLVFVHGGGWAGGSRRMVEPLGREMALRGYLFITPDYRLIPGATVAEATGDVIQAWEWARNFAGQHGKYAGQIAFGGESAGSHLSTGALLAMASRNDALPAAQIAVFGPHDMESFLAKATPLVRSAMRALRYPHGSLKAAAPGLSSLNRPWPKSVDLLTVHGDRDTLVPYRMSLALHRHAQTHGAHAEHLRVRGAPHGFINTPRTRYAWPAVQAIDRFLSERLRTASTAKSIA